MFLDRIVSIAFAIVLVLATVTSALAMEESAKVRVSGDGRVNLAPDMAIVNMGVTRQAKTARQALSDNTAAMSEVLQAMQSAGIDAADLQTANFSVQPQFTYPKNDTDGENKPIVSAYIVRNSVTVRIRDLEILGGVLDQAVSLGVNDGGNILFTNDDPTDAIAEARAKAVKDAVAKARTLADAAGVGLGAILEISEGQSGGRPRPLANARVMEMAAASAPVPVAAGENTYSVVVNMTFEIEQ